MVACELKLNFGTPEHGWLAVEVATPGWSRSETVSDVPCDSLAQLVRSLVLIASNSPHEEVEWSLEPGYWRWAFRADQNSLVFTVSGESNKHTIRLCRERALRVFCRALLRLEADPVWADDESPRTWSWEFPHESLGRLRETVLDT